MMNQQQQPTNLELNQAYQQLLKAEEFLNCRLATLQNEYAVCAHLRHNRRAQALAQQKLQKLSWTQTKLTEACVLKRQFQKIMTSRAHRTETNQPDQDTLNAMLGYDVICALPKQSAVYLMAHSGTSFFHYTGFNMQRTSATPPWTCFYRNRESDNCIAEGLLFKAQRQDYVARPTHKMSELCLFSQWLFKISDNFKMLAVDGNFNNQIIVYWDNDRFAEAGGFDWDNLKNVLLKLKADVHKKIPMLSCFDDDF